MESKVFFLVLFIGVVCWTAPARSMNKLPAFLKSCKLDKNFDNCMMKNGNLAIPTLAKGDAKWKIPVLDPLKVPSVSISESSAKSIALNITLNDLEIYGLKESKLVASRFISPPDATMVYKSQPWQSCSHYDTTSDSPRSSVTSGYALYSHEAKPSGDENVNSCTELRTFMQPFDNKKTNMNIVCSINLNTSPISQIIQFDVNRKHVVWKIAVPRLTLLSKYKMAGKFLVLPITGSGPATVMLESPMLTYKFDYKLVKRNNENYMQVTKSDLKHTTTRLRINFENLFNGDKTLGASTNKLINENWEEFNQELAPSVVQAIGAILTQILSSIAKTVPYDNFFIK